MVSWFGELDQGDRWHGTVSFADGCGREVSGQGGTVGCILVGFIERLEREWDEQRWSL